MEQNVLITRVVNIKKAELNKRGIANFAEWAKLPDSVYIGRNMSFYVPGTIASKWKNPFNAKKYGLDKCLEMYREHLSKSGLINDIEELRGKELGCWCKPAKCHGDVLIEILDNKQEN